MRNLKILRKIALKDGSVSKTRHINSGNNVSGGITNLAIAQYLGDSGYYLFYYDSSGVTVSDTYHDTLDGAFDQANFEFRP